MVIETTPAQPEPDIRNQLPQKLIKNDLGLPNAKEGIEKDSGPIHRDVLHGQHIEQPRAFHHGDQRIAAPFPPAPIIVAHDGHVAFASTACSDVERGRQTQREISNAFRRRIVCNEEEGDDARATHNPEGGNEGQPKSKGHIKQPNWSLSFKNTVKSSYVNYLLVIVPVSWALHFSGQGDVIVFIFSLIAVIPLASLLSFATEQLSLHVGEALGGLLNATLGNAVELLIAILALVNGDIDLVQASMIGSIVSNTLLVLGMSYFAGGLRFHEQVYAVAGSNTMISMLGLSMAAILLPAGFHYSFPSTQSSEAGRPYLIVGEEQLMLLKISRGLSFILLAAYAVYLVFILYTHAYLFRIPRAPRPHTLPGAPHPPTDKVFPRPRWVPSMRSGSTASTDDLDAIVSRDSAPPTRVDTNDTAQSESVTHGEDEVDEVELPLIKWQLAVGLLLLTTGITGVTAEWLVESVDGLTEQTNVSREFVGLILLPVIGNSVEHIAAVTVSVKDKLNLSMAIAIGSSIQVALGLLPVLVLVGWAIGQPMMLFFDTFETFVLTVSLLVVNFAIADGKTNYLEGAVLMLTWVMIATTCWFYDPLV